MKANIIIRMLALALLVVISFSSCTQKPSGTELPSMGSGENRLTPDSSKIADFSKGAPEGFWARNDRGNGHPFNCAFYRSNAVISDGLLTISLTKGDDRYIGAEYRSNDRFSYGYYSVSMKAAKGEGVISSFFTYTGWPWDEIDIEFLGDDTTRVQFNYYTNGVGGHEYIYHLGFDASLEFHEYAFDWQKDSITWYVDGRAVYKATKNIPSTPGQIMVNIWNVADTNKDWAGKFNESCLPTSAQYQWIGYQGETYASDR